MPSKKKKYNARFPAGRIKKIMQSDEEVGKVAQAVPVIISRTLELFVESLLTKTLKITNSRNAKTLSPSHMKQCIMAENRFDFLRELVKNIPDISVSEETGQDGSINLPGTPIIESPPQQEPYDLSKPSTSCESNFPIFSNTNSNGNSIIRNGNNNNNNNSIGNKINITTSNNTIIGTNNISSLPTQTATRKLSTLGYISTSTTQSTTILPNSREELMRQWDTVSQIRQQMLSTMQAKTTTTTTVPIQQTITSSSTMNFYNSNNNDNNRKTLNSTPITDCTPPKLKRMDSLPATTDKFTNININIDKKNRKLQHQPKSLPSSDLLSLQQQDNKLPAIPAPIIDMDICNKPIIKIDYSNLNLHDNNNYPILTSSNNNNNNDNSKINTKNHFTNSNKTNLITQTSLDLTKKNSAITTFNPIINIDLSKIGTQPATIHFNLGNITTASTNNNSSSTKIDTKNNSSAIRSSSLDLDEDYDNI